MTIQRLALITISALLLTNCAYNRRIVVGLSPDMETRYSIYPSIEFDVAAITNDEADQIKTSGVDGYFSPDNPLRERLEPFTAYFDEESTAPCTLSTRNSLWLKWENKKPEKMVFIANLPYFPDMPQNDPRLFFIDLKKDFLTPVPMYVEIEPEKIVRIYKKPTDPRSNRHDSSQSDKN
ncbi:MAG: hypothetical protein LBC27_04665 [Spirochaetaceae bacterium]|jgi:hypothetical protein|nr:hypothetical protein [Spirochaetaceae bacterium]